MRGSVSDTRASLIGRSRLAATLAFVLAFAVSTDAAHSHQDDHDDQHGERFVCEICLKQAQEDDFIAFTAVDRVTPPIGELPARVTPAPLSAEIPQVRSRSPPLP